MRIISWYWITLALLAVAISGHAQNYRHDDVVQSRSGQPAPGALVAVCTQPCTVPSNVSISTPPSPLAPLCSSSSDVGCTSPNPVTADGLGNFHFYVAPGKYTVVFYGSGLSTSTQVDQVYPCDPTNCTISLGSLAPTSSAQLAAVITDESGTGPLPFANGSVIASKSENSLAILHADQYANWSAIQTACIAAGGCTVDARSFISPLAMGTIDSGATVEHIWLAPIIIFTLDHVVVRSGFEMAGMGIEDIQGTQIQAVGAANQAPFVMPASASPQSIQGVILRDFSLKATVGNTAQDGLFFDVSVGNLPAGSNLESSTFERIAFQNFKGSARHLKGRIDAATSAIQFNNFIQNDVIVPTGNTTVGSLLRIEGTVGQNYFWNDALGQSVVSGTTLAYLGVTNTGDAVGPYSNWFYGATIQGGDVGVIINGCQSCTFRDTHAEADKVLFQIKTPTTWHNNKILLDGGVANGNVGTNSGSGAILDASDSSNSSSTTSVQLSNWSIEGTPDKLAKCPSGLVGVVVLRDNNFDQTSPAPSTSNCTPGYSTSTTTINIGNSRTAFINGCSGGSVTTLVSAAATGEMVSLYFNAPCSFTTGGNIFANGIQAPVSLLAGDTALFFRTDLSGDNFMLLSAGQKNRFSGTAAMTTAGILTGACGTTVTVAASGVLTTDIISVTRNVAATIGDGGGLTLNAWPTAGNVNFNYCNSAVGTITPTAVTVNWSVIR